ncbi:MAG TPA: phosphoglucomutase/phosphomannomutase family protein [bacterium]|nr:phosphoglucomutase/phosphomannomutase family protein [bacterium]
MSDPIHFGTDGWRAKIADTFTFPNVRRAAFGLGRSLRPQKGAKVLVGFDGRFNSDLFAREAARTLARLGHRVLLSDRILPTPALSLAVRDQRADAGVMITASHNSGAYNGFKVKVWPGVSAPEAFTRAVEKNIPAHVPEPPPAELPAADWLSPYLKKIGALVDLRAIRKAGLKVVFDSMHGVGERHFESLVAGGKTKVTTVAGERDVFFGGRQPEPIGPQLAPLTKAIRRARADLGFATDGDGDRVGVMDGKGRYVHVHRLHGILLYHLWVNRGMRGAVVKTVSGTRMLSRMARAWDIPLYETPIGFKYIGEIMLREDVLLGVEESGGIAVKGHLAERDGLFSALLILEALVAMKKSVGEAVDFVQKCFGPYFSDRLDLENVPAADQARILARLKKAPPLSVAGEKITGVQALDGVRFDLKDGWVMARASGTEPLLRLYAESPSAAKTGALLGAIRREALKSL